MPSEKQRKVDKNVENTNSESLLSKLSVVSQGYRLDPFLKELCSQPDIKSRRSPAINRGYLARLLALEVSFEKLLLTGIFKQVLSLGAGFDSMYFRLKNSQIIGEGIKYVEVDYPESVRRKDARISRSSLLRSFFKIKKVVKNEIFTYDDGALILIGCDMIKTNELRESLMLAGFDPGAPTLILTECSTTYIKADECDNLLRMLTNFLKNFAFISYEQIRPFDDFGKIMVNHFEKRNSSLKCVKNYPTTDQHRQRFLNHGWDQVYVRTIQEIWNKFVNEADMKLLDSVEMFDEAPELMLKCLHYVLIIGTWKVQLPLESFWVKPNDQTTESLKLHIQSIQPSNNAELFQR